MPTNDFLLFGTAVGANVMTQADYLALASRSTGFSSGTAKSAQLNKAWRQSSIIAAMLAQFIADQSGQNAIDDGTTATLQANLLTAIRAAATGRLLRTTTYINNAGTLQSSVDGSAFANASSTFTALAATRKIIAEGLGGGASGGGSAATPAGQVAAGSGGGGGAYAKGTFTSGFSSLLVAVGAGGLPGAIGADGLAGGTTSLGALMSIPGGVAGQAGTSITPPAVGGATPSLSGTPTGGNIVSSQGAAGLPGIVQTGGYGGAGANSIYGVGGWSPVTAGGRSGSGYGSGSSGSFSPPSTGTARASVAGQPGLLIIQEFA